MPIRCCVLLVRVRRQLRERRPDGVVNEAQVQVAYADLIILNKVRHAGGSIRGA